MPKLIQNGYNKCECELVLLNTPDIPTLRDIFCFITTQAQQHTTKGVLTPQPR